MNTRACPNASLRAGFKDLLIVSLWSAIGLSATLAMAWFDLG